MFIILAVLLSAYIALFVLAMSIHVWFVTVYLVYKSDQCLIVYVVPNNYVCVHFYMLLYKVVFIALSDGNADLFQPIITLEMPYLDFQNIQ